MCVKATKKAGYEIKTSGIHVYRISHHEDDELTLRATEGKKSAHLLKFTLSIVGLFPQNKLCKPKSRSWVHTAD